MDPGALGSLEVTLGSQEDFQRAEVPRSDYLDQLEFRVIDTSDGNAVVEVTSEQPMKEPFLHFLVAVEWSGGKLVREYTGLLDPPLYAGESPTQIESPAIESGQTARDDEPASAPADEPASTVSTVTQRLCQRPVGRVRSDPRRRHFVGYRVQPGYRSRGCERLSDHDRPAAAEPGCLHR